MQVYAKSPTTTRSHSEQSVFSRLSLIQKLLTVHIASIVIIALLTLGIIIGLFYTSAQNSVTPRLLEGFVNLMSQSYKQQQHNNASSDILPSLFEIAINHPQVQAVAFYDKDQKLVYSEQKNLQSGTSLPSTLPETQSYPSADVVSFSQSLTTLNKEVVGTLWIQASPLQPNLYQAGLMFCLMVIFVISLIFIWLSQQVMHHSITQPIKHLTHIVGEVTQSEVFSLRADIQSHDEIGHLASAFNQMLERIELRDQLLTAERDKAEKASLRAITLSEETKQANKRLEFEVQVRTKIERKLTDFQNYLNNIINSMPSGLIAVDGHFFVAQWNQEASRLAGTSTEKALGARLDEAFPSLSKHIDIISKSLVEREIQKIEKVQIDTGESSKHCDLVIYPLRETGSMGAVIRIDDVTQRLAMEEIMVQTEKMMSVGGLAAGMAHEINNPLGAIIQSTQNINRRLSSNLPKNMQVAKEFNTNMEDINGYLETRGILRFLKGIHDAGERAATIVSNMLQFSRQSSQVMVPVDVKDLLERTIDIAANDYNFAGGYDFKHINLVKDYDPHLGTIPCLASELEQVILNLLQNAAQALKDHSQNEHISKNWQAEIRVCTQKTRNGAVITIGDNGPGMEESVRRRIFEPFFTTKDVGIGTGLGLSVSYFIITYHHKGTLQVDSQKNRGSTFTIHLPNDHH